jgi:NADH-quinone oxidoreductase subunit B
MVNCCAPTYSRPKTGIFNITLGSSRVVIDSIKSEQVPPPAVKESLKKYGVGRLNDVGGGNLIIQWFKRRSLIKYLVNWGRLSSLFPVQRAGRRASRIFSATYALSR